MLKKGTGFLSDKEKFHFDIFNLWIFNP
jgi:hypothetical protein